MLTHKSLQALIDISKHVSLSKKLSHIIIATNVYGEIPLRFKDEDAATCYIQGYEDQKTLLSTGIDREMLTEAFERLDNLSTIGIRDFNAVHVSHLASFPVCCTLWARRTVGQLNSRSYSASVAFQTQRSSSQITFGQPLGLYFRIQLHCC